MQTIIQGLHYGARRLWKQLGFTLLAVLTLSLGLGANTAIFRVVDAVFFRVLADKESAPPVVALTGLAQTAPSDNEVIAKAEEYLNALARLNRFNGVVLIARDGKTLVSKSYGMANVEDAVPNTPQTRFPIASITKTFTATAVLMLQERGKLSVQDAICKHLPDCPAAWQAITIHHLLTHTSGIPDYSDLPD